jgi:hypothetical protein
MHHEIQHCSSHLFPGSRFHFDSYVRTYRSVNFRCALPVIDRVPSDENTVPAAAFRTDLP